jgi:hypothetical protein
MKFFLIQKHRQQFARATRSTMREVVGEFKWSAPHQGVILTGAGGNNIRGPMITSPGP